MSDCIRWLRFINGGLLRELFFHGAPPHDCDGSVSLLMDHLAILSKTLDAVDVGSFAAVHINGGGSVNGTVALYFDHRWGIIECMYRIARAKADIIGETEMVHAQLGCELRRTVQYLIGLFMRAKGVHRRTAQKSDRGSMRLESSVVVTEMWTLLYLVGADAHKRKMSDAWGLWDLIRRVVATLIVGDGAGEQHDGGIAGQGSSRAEILKGCWNLVLWLVQDNAVLGSEGDTACADAWAPLLATLGKTAVTVHADAPEDTPPSRWFLARSVKLSAKLPCSRPLLDAFWRPQLKCTWRRLTSTCKFLPLSRTCTLSFDIPVFERCGL
jgi:hypothetical protein